MNRLLALAICVLGIVYGVTACGGGADDGTPSEDKLTVVGAGA